MKLGAEPAVGLTGHAAADQRLRRQHLPVGEPWGIGRTDVWLGEGGRIDWLEEAGTLEVRRHDAGNVDAKLLILASTGEVRDGNRQRLNVTARNVDLDQRRGRHRPG